VRELGADRVELYTESYAAAFARDHATLVIDPHDERDQPAPERAVLARRNAAWAPAQP
jgi:hypothetical protein